MRIEVIIQKAEQRYEAVIDPDKDYDLTFGLFGEGSTVAETKNDFMVSLEDMKALYKDEGLTFPKLDFHFKYDLPSFLEYYSKIFSFAALERLTGINQVQLSQYVRGYRRPSAKTTKKIEEKLHGLAEDLGQVQFF